MARYNWTTMRLYLQFIAAGLIAPILTLSPAYALRPTSDSPARISDLTAGLEEGSSPLVFDRRKIVTAAAAMVFFGEINLCL